MIDPIHRKQLLRLKRVSEATGLSRSTIDYLIGRGEFPRPVKIARRSIAWDADEIDAWICGRLSDRAAGVPQVLLDEADVIAAEIVGKEGV